MHGCPFSMVYSCSNLVIAFERMNEDYDGSGYSCLETIGLLMRRARTCRTLLRLCFPGYSSLGVVAQVRDLSARWGRDAGQVSHDERLIQLCADELWHVERRQVKLPIPEASMQTSYSGTEAKYPTGS